MLPQPPQVFSVRGFEALFPLAGALGYSVCLIPQLLLPVNLHASVEMPTLPVVTLPQVLSARLPVSAPPTGLGECFFFNPMVVGLPYSLIFCQFWLLLVLNLLSFFWLCQEAQCVPPSWPEVCNSFPNGLAKQTFFVPRFTVGLCPDKSIIN